MANGGVVAQEVADEIPARSQNRPPPREAGPAAAAPPELCPTETTGDGKEGEKMEGGRWLLGLGAGRVAPGERATRGSWRYLRVSPSIFSITKFLTIKI
jgi:hypothetical protein